ncbi:hypothetical protein R3P38DRAFT_3207579 [Favolaschia claudopus]|uniref:Uncharacterized protein n=1 Tax=Favolaschia claudopus TaxID=2862362 RepID=A0AAW0AJE5_9AGAR
MELPAIAAALPPSQTLIAAANTTAGTRRRTSPRLDYPPAEASRITFHAGTQTPLFRAHGPAAAPTLVLCLVYHTVLHLIISQELFTTSARGRSTHCTSHPPHTPAPPPRRTPPLSIPSIPSRPHGVWARREVQPDTCPMLSANGSPEGEE